MTLKLTADQLAALHSANPGEPVRVEDESARRTYWLVSPEEMPALWAEYVRREVEKGVEAAERGEVVDWNPGAMKELARAAAERGAHGG